MQHPWAFQYRCHGPNKGGEGYCNEGWTGRKVGRGVMGGGFDNFAYRGP